MSVGDRLRVVVVGAGGWGWQHARVVREHRGLELCGVCARGRERAEARAGEFGCKAYTDIREMVERERPGLVMVSLPNREHFGPTMEVLGAVAPGTGLLVEKPLVFEMGEADALLAEAERRGVGFFAINFNHRYAKPVQIAKRAIEEGRLGEIVFASWRFGGEGGTDHPFNNLIETQCHGFDLLEHLCGPVGSVMAQMTDKTHAGVFRTVALALQFRNGAVGTLLGSYDSSYAYPGTHQLEVNGTRGRIWVEDTVRRYRFNAAGSETGEVWEAGYFNDRDREFHRTFDRHLADVVARLMEGKPPPVHARAGRRALRLALAAVTSFREGRRVGVGAEDWEG